MTAGMPVDSRAGLGRRTGRAVVAVAMLAGVYVLALVIMAALVAAAVVLVRFTAAAGAKLALLFVFAAGAVLIGVVRALRVPKFQAYGVRLTEPDQPALWAMVRDTAARVVTRAPDEIYLVPEVNAAVVEDAGWFGLRSGRRYLLVGLPLFVTMNVDQLRAVLGHELGHYSHAHTRLAEVNYRGRNAALRTIRQLGNGGALQAVVRWIFVQYAKAYFLVESSVSRAQEFEADRAAALIAGREAMRTALLELPALSAAWSFYLQRYVSEGLEYGFAPREVFTTFPTFVAARRAELDELRGSTPEDETSRWDSHPAIGQRVAALEGLPEFGAAHDPRPAYALLAAVDALVPALERETVDFGGRRRMDWPEYTARSYHAFRREAADAYYRALSRTTGRSPECLETVLAYAETDRLDDLRRQIDEANGPREVGPLAAIEVALLEAGAAHVRHRWDGPPALTRPDGSELELDPVLEALAAGPVGVAKVRAFLAECGVDPRRAIGQASQASARTAELLAAVAPVKLDRSRYDVLVTDEGFVFVPITGAFKLRRPEGRLGRLVRERPVAELAADPANLWLPYEEIARVELLGKARVRARITVHGGRSYLLAAPFDLKGLGDSAKTFAQAVGSLAARTNP